MKIFSLSRLENIDASIDFYIITSCTNKDLVFKRLEEEYNRTIRSFKENEDDFSEIRDDNSISIFNDEIDILLEVREVELEGSLCDLQQSEDIKKKFDKIFKIIR